MDEAQSEFGDISFRGRGAGGVGYLQYFSGVPAQLVAVHVAFAIAVWISVLRLWIAARY